MDSPANVNSKPNRLIYTLGKGSFEELEHFDVPAPGPKDIQVRTVMTGICRSDIEMMQGNFGPLPLGMQGHEGLGEVIAKGSEVTDVEIGDFVATRGEPAFADYYNCRHQEYVRVPMAHPRYIIEPTACGINIITQNLFEVKDRSGQGRRMLILGSGFLVWVAYHTVKNMGLEFEIDVVGSYNRELWGDILKSEPSGKYDVIVDLSSRTDIFDLEIYKPQTLLILGSQKTVTTNLCQLLWNACTMICPSPRNDNFYNTMQLAVEWVRVGKLKVDHFWTHSYDRDLNWRDAFAEGLERKIGYNRGYICW